MEQQVHLPMNDWHPRSVQAAESHQGDLQQLDQGRVLRFGASRRSEVSARRAACYLIVLPASREIVEHPGTLGFSQNSASFLLGRVGEQRGHQASRPVEKAG